MADFSQNRSVFIRIFFIAIPVIIVLRLLFLQVFDFGGYKEAALGQAVYIKKIYPPRGIIYDRKGEVLMNNSVVYDLTIEPKKVKADFDTAFLCKLININTADFSKQFTKLIKKYGWQSKNLTLFRNLSPAIVARLQENIYEFHGIDLIAHAERNFSYDCGGGILGFINEISESQLNDEKYSDYEKGDYIGVRGLEYTYEEELRGSPGVQYLLRDVKQRIQGPYKNGEMDSSSIPGKKIELFLDAKLQKLAETMMQNKLGCAIAIDPKTGGVLAYANGPTFDPKLLTGADKGKNLVALYNDATKPLLNRGIQATYTPGSTFKPLTALVALDQGVITPSYGYGCNGGYFACGRKVACTHTGAGHAANLGLAIANSCNAYFCHVFRLSIDAAKYGNVHVGLQKWHHYMNDFGLGHPTGIDLPNEKGGQIPDSNFFNKMYNGNWNSCMMSIIGMGQGEILLTPLQMANSMCLIANKGFYFTPHFVKSIDGDSTHPKLKPFLIKHKIGNIADSSYQWVAAGMQEVVEQGTGKIAKLPDVAVCAKTGTAQNNGSMYGKVIKLPNHSMFVAFAPRDNPKIAVAVAIENGGYGATWGGPIASLMIEQYLHDTISSKRVPLLKKMQTAKIIINYTYLRDSLDRQKYREKVLLKNGNKDSLRKAIAIKDSIKHSKDSMLARYYFQKVYGKKLNN